MKHARPDAITPAHSRLDHFHDLRPSSTILQVEASGDKESRRDAALILTVVGLAVTLVAGALLSPAGFAVALAIFCSVSLAVTLAPRPPGPFGTANRITLARAGGAAVFGGLALNPAPLAGPGGWVAAGTGAVFLALDGVDGWFARREGRVSAYGARLDMEVDALTMLALSALLLALGKAGPWILAIGLMRYAFVAAGAIWPRLARPLPPSRRRRAVCAVQVGTLTALLAPPLVPPVSTGIAVLALALLVWSFALDLRRLATT